jgi:hypothetical protein
MSHSALHPRNDLEMLRGIHSGRSFLVVGCGPSTAEYDFRDTDGAIVLASNSAGSVVTPDYYSIFDPVSFAHFKSIFYSRPCARILPPWIRSPCDYRIGYRTEDERGFSTDRLYHGRSSGYLNVGLAAIMGASSIHLIGIDGYDLPFADVNFCDTPLDYRLRSLRKWTADRRALTLSNYAEAAAFLASRGVPLINWSRRSFLAELPMVEQGWR